MAKKTSGARRSSRSSEDKPLTMSCVIAVMKAFRATLAFSKDPVAQELGTLADQTIDIWTKRCRRLGEERKKRSPLDECCDFCHPCS